MSGWYWKSIEWSWRVKCSAMFLNIYPSFRPSHRIGPTQGACFSKVPKLFGPISGDIILFISSKRRRLEARNFTVIFILFLFIPLQHMKRPTLQDKQVGVLRMAFRARKVFGTFEKRAQGQRETQTSGPFLESPEKFSGLKKPLVKLRPAYSVKLVFSRVVNGWKMKRNVKFRASGRLRVEDTKRIMLPEMRPKASGLSRNGPLVWDLNLLPPESPFFY